MKDINVDPTTLLIGAICLLVGLAAGSLLTRTLSPQLKKQRELEEQLRRTEDEFKIYQQDVTEHFLKSSELLQDLTQTYRAVGEHLGAGAMRLTTPAVSRQIMDATNPQLGTGYGPRTLSSIAAEPPKDYAPSVPGGVLSENYGLHDKGGNSSSGRLYTQGITRDEDDYSAGAENDDPTYKVG